MSEDGGRSPEVDDGSPSSREAEGECDEDLYIPETGRCPDLLASLRVFKFELLAGHDFFQPN